MAKLIEYSNACCLCHNSLFHTILAESDFSILKCDECGLALTSPADYVYQSDYDGDPNFADGYAKKEAKFRPYARRFLKSIRRYTTGDHLLEVGCSVGLMVDEASLMGFQAEGIDLDSNAIEFGKSLGRPIHRSLLHDWPTKNYDTICASHTLEHIPQPDQFVAECADHLKPGGLLAVVLPCYAGLHPRIFGSRWYGWVPHQHYFHYTAYSLTRLFQSAGLETVQVWQESMEHRPTRASLKSGKKTIIWAAVGYLVASIGSVFGQGDQLVGLARRPDKVSS